MLLINCKNAIQREKDTLIKMVRIFCKAKHNNSFCKDCVELMAYAENRLDKCKFGVSKPTCERCTVHCYKALMRERIKEVMRYSGPRMILYHPVDAIRHLIKNKRSK